MASGRFRTNSRVPSDALVIHPLKQSFGRQFARAPLPQSGGMRLLGAIASLLALAFGIFLVLETGVDGLAYLFIFFVIGAGAIIWLLQPGTLLYATPERVGQRTMFGTRYEVPAKTVTAIRIGYLAFEGSQLPTIVFEGAQGECLMRHYNVSYDEADLTKLALYAGVAYV
jgi:hypothetical protein